MRLAATLALLLLSSAAAAQTPKPDAAPPSPPDTWVPRGTAELKVLNKVDAHVDTVTLKVGEAADNASLSIALRACAIRPPDLPQDSAAYLDIKDSRPGAPGFHGWIFANEPAVSMLEHPIYDVRLIGCK